MTANIIHTSGIVNQFIARGIVKRIVQKMAECFLHSFSHDRIAVCFFRIEHCFEFIDSTYSTLHARICIGERFVIRCLRTT